MKATLKSPTTSPGGTVGPEDALLREADALQLSPRDRAELREAMRARAVGTRREKRRADDLLWRVRARLATSARETLAQAQVQAELTGEVATGERAAVAHNDAGAVRLRPRDGLACLAEAGRIDAAELACGLAYRALYEQTQGGLPSQLRPGVAGRSVDDDAGAAAGRRAAAHARRARLDRMVATELAEQPKALLALRLIAGEARTVRSLTGGGEETGRMIDGLRAAVRLLTDRCGVGLDSAPH